MLISRLAAKRRGCIIKTMNKSWLLPAISVFALALIVFLSSGTVSQPVNYGPTTSFASIEKGVASFSPNGASGGVAIPASCESGYEHYPGECAGYSPSSPSSPPPSTDCGGHPCSTAWISANPTTIYRGEPSILTWGSTNSNMCYVTALGWRGPSGSEVIYPESTADYTANCMISQEDSWPYQTPPVRITVLNRLPAVSLSANPSTINRGQQSTLSWTSSNADWCDITNDVGPDIGRVDLNGSKQVTLTETTVYTLTCVNTYGTGVANATVTVRPLPIVDLQAPRIVDLPDPISLTWFTQYADSCAASPSENWSGGKSTPNGSESIPKPRGTYTFNLSCTGSGGSGSDSQTVRVVQLPRCSFTANPLSIIPPATSPLSWSCLYADSCTIDHGIGSVNNVSGSTDVRPPVTTIYNLSCSNADGSRSWPATVGIGFLPQLKEILPRP